MGTTPGNAPAYLTYLVIFDQNQFWHGGFDAATKVGFGSATGIRDAIRCAAECTAQNNASAGVMRQESALRDGALIAAFAKAGFTPTITMEATEHLAALGLVAAGLGVTSRPRPWQRIVRRIAAVRHTGVDFTRAPVNRISRERNGVRKICAADDVQARAAVIAAGAHSGDLATYGREPTIIGTF